MVLREPSVSGARLSTGTYRAGSPALSNRILTRRHTVRGIDCCPHCQGDQVINWGKKEGNRRYRCTQCKRTFNPLTNTELAHLRHRERWISFIGAMVEHKSLREAAAICGISLSTAQRWRNRLLGYVAQHGPMGLILLDSLQELLLRL